MKAMNAEHANRWDSKAGCNGRGAQETPRRCEQRSSGRSTRTLGARSRVAAFLLFAAGFATYAFAADKQLKSVGLTVGDLGNPFFAQIAHGARDQAKTYNPDVKFTALSSNYDVNDQASQIDGFVSSGVDLIILGAADSKKIAPAVKRAKAAGIVVVAVDVGAEGGVDATVMSDNKQAGEEAGQFIADKLQGKGQVVIVNGPPVTSVQDRVAGVLSVLKKHSGIKILSQDQNADGTPDGGLRVMNDCLTAYPHVDAVFGINDPTALGCDRAAKQAGRTGFFIVGVDGSPEAVAALKSNQDLFTATAAQDPYTMAQKAVEIGYDIKQGKKPEKDVTLIPVKLITRDNVAEYSGWTR
jgi:ribose transport system substrate-binding protein